MFVFQLTAKAENAIYDPAKQQAVLPTINRQIRPHTVFSTTMEAAEKKIDLLIQMHDARMSEMDRVSGITFEERSSGQKGWDAKKCADALERMGYPDGEVEFGRLSLSTRFEKTLMDAHEAVGKLGEAYQALEKERNHTADPILNRALGAMMEDFAFAANAAAGAALKEEERFVLFKSQEWAESEPWKLKEVFYHLVDANAYLAYESMSGLYNLRYPVKGRLEYVVNQTQTELEREYSAICVSEYRLDRKAEEGFPKLVSDYISHSKSFDTRYKKTIEKETSWFEFEKKVREAPTGAEKLCAASAPFVEAATPVVAALSMLSPYTSLFGYSYFTNASIESFRAGEYWQGTLMALTTAAPIFSEMAGSGIGFVSTTGKVGAVSSRGAGLLFQVDIGISTGRLLVDGAKYGLSVEQLRELESNVGFIIMPSIVRKSLFSEVVPEKKPVGFMDFLAPEKKISLRDILARKTEGKKKAKKPATEKKTQKISEKEKEVFFTEPNAIEALELEKNGDFEAAARKYTYAANFGLEDPRFIEEMHAKEQENYAKAEANYLAEGRYYDAAEMYETAASDTSKKNMKARRAMWFGKAEENYAKAGRYDEIVRMYTEAAKEENNIRFKTQYIEKRDENSLKAEQKNDAPPNMVLDKQSELSLKEAEAFEKEGNFHLAGLRYTFIADRTQDPRLKERWQSKELENYTKAEATYQAEGKFESAGHMFARAARGESADTKEAKARRTMWFSKAEENYDKSEDHGWTAPMYREAAKAENDIEYKNLYLDKKRKSFAQSEERYRAEGRFEEAAQMYKIAAWKEEDVGERTQYFAKALELYSLQAGSEENAGYFRLLFSDPSRKNEQAIYMTILGEVGFSPEWMEGLKAEIDLLVQRIPDNDLDFMPDAIANNREYNPIVFLFIQNTIYSRNPLERNADSRVEEAFSRFLRYAPLNALHYEDLVCIRKNEADFVELSTLQPMGFVPTKMVLERYSGGDETTRRDIVSRIRGEVPFDIDNELGVAIEYGKMLPPLKANNNGMLVCDYVTFKEMLIESRQANAGMVAANEMSYAGYEISKIYDNVQDIAEKGPGRVLIFGNMRLGLIYSNTLQEMLDPQSAYFGFSRIGSTEMHGAEYILKAELFTDKKMLKDMFDGTPLMVLDASVHKRSPDAYKAYRAYFAALEFMRRGKENSYQQNALEEVAAQTNVGVETLETLRDELFAADGGFYRSMKGWFLHADRMKPFKVFDYDADGVNQYRIKRDFIGDYGQMKTVENVMPTEQDLKDYNCIILTQASISDGNIPVAIKEKIGVNATHSKGYFDDKDHLLSMSLSYDANGVKLTWDLSQHLAESAQEVREKTANSKKKE